MGTKARTSVQKHIQLAPQTWIRLERFMRHSFGGYRVLSAIVNKAIEEYLDRQEGKTPMQ